MCVCVCVCVRLWLWMFLCACGCVCSAKQAVILALGLCVGSGETLGWKETIDFSLAKANFGKLLIRRCFVARHYGHNDISSKPNTQVINRKLFTISSKIYNPLSAQKCLLL